MDFFSVRYLYMQQQRATSGEPTYKYWQQFLACSTSLQNNVYSVAWNVAKGSISYSMFSVEKPLTKRKKDQLVILFIHMENPQIGFQYLFSKSLSILMNFV